MAKLSKTILLVEDDPPSGITESHWLKKAGFDVIHVLEGNKAIETVKEKKYLIDLILMDINLGDGINGIQAAQEILKEYNIPVLFLSARSEKDIVEKAEKISAYGYVIKDAAETVLLASINFALKLHKMNKELAAKEEALRLSEEKFSKAFNTSPDAITISRLSDGLYIEVNNGFTQLSGYTASEVIGRTSTRLGINLWVNLEDRDKLVKQVLEHGEAVNLEIPFRIKDGSIRIGLMSSKLVEINNEQHILSVITDVTNRKEAEKSHKASEEKYRSLFDNASIGIFHSLPEGKFIQVNPSLARMLGYESPEEMINSITDINSQIFVDTKKRQQLLEKVKKLDGWLRTENQYRRKDGSVLTGNLTVRKVLKPDGTINYLEGFVEDITERKKAEEALLYEQYLSNSLIDNSPDRIYFKDLNSRFIRINKLVAELFGLRNAGDAIGKTDFDFFTEEHARQAFEDEQRIIKTGESIIGLEEKETWPNGNETWVTTNKLPLLDINGKIIGTFGISRDITEYKKSQEALLYEQYLLYSLMDNTPDHIYFKDLESRFIRLNKSQAEIFGLKNSTEAIGKTDFDFFLEEHARQAFEDENKVIKTGTPIIDIIEKETWPDGHETWVSTNKLPLLDKDGKIIGTFGISRDITERKHAEEQLEKYAEELKILNSTKDKFFSIIAHDLKNPFNSIMSTLELLITEKESLTENEAQTFLVNILKTSKKAYSLLENLLQWSLHQMHKIEFEPVKLKLSELVLENINILKDNASLKNISLINNTPDDVSVLADKNMLNTILRNLISNAVKFTPDNGTVKVESRYTDNKIEVSVIDNGIGISRANISKLFRIDHSFSTSGTRNETGTGLGLILCKEFIEKNNGEFFVESTVGKGSRFYFMLPLCL